MQEGLKPEKVGAVLPCHAAFALLALALPWPLTGCCRTPPPISALTNRWLDLNQADDLQVSEALHSGQGRVNRCPWQPVDACKKIEYVTETGAKALIEDAKYNDLVDRLVSSQEFLFDQAGECGDSSWALGNQSRTGYMDDVDTDGSEALLYLGKRQLEPAFVAVVDSGVRDQVISSPGIVVTPTLFSWPRVDPAAEEAAFHGSHVAAIISGRRDPPTAIAPGAHIVDVHVTKPVQADDMSWRNGAVPAKAACGVCGAVQWSKKEGRELTAINVSLAGVAPASGSGVLDDVLTQAADDENILVVVAAGNRPKEAYPASVLGDPARSKSNVLVVTSMAGDGTTGGSNQGPWVHLAAPGRAVLTYDSLGQACASGSSAAAPFVAGTAALLAQSCPDLSTEEIRARIMAGACPMSWGPKHYVNTCRALFGDIKGCECRSDLGGDPVPTGLGPACDALKLPSNSDP